MSFTVNNAANKTAPAASITVTISIAQGHTVALIGYGAGGNQLTGAFTDSASNSYTAGNSVIVTGGSQILESAYLIGLPAGITTVKYTPAGPSTVSALYVWDITSSGTISYATSAGHYYAFNAPNTTDGVSTGSLTVTSTDALIVAMTQSVASASMSGGTGFTVDANPVPVFNIIYEHKAVSSSAAATFTDGTNNDQVFCLGLALQAVPIIPKPYGDGSSSGATSAATGTNGQAMAAIVVGNVLDVIVHITNSTVPTGLTVSDGHNVYNGGSLQFGCIDLFDDSANGQIWYRFACNVTNGLTTPVITVSGQAGYFPTNMSIFAGILTGISITPTPPFTTGNIAHGSTIVGANQVSGFTPTLAGGLGVNYTASAFAMDVGTSFPVAAPAAGSGYTSQGTAWAFISSGGTTPTLLWQTQQIPTGTAPAQATAVYGSGRPYTLLAVYNNLLLPISPSGPMPRQLYIMPQMFIQQLRLEYPDHTSEIQALNFILAQIQQGEKPHNQALVEYILKRLDELMLDQYETKPYNQFEVHR